MRRGPARHKHAMRPGVPGLLLAGAALAALIVTLPASAQRGGTEFVPTFSTNPRLKQQVDRLGRLAGQKLWDEWIQTYQALVSDPSDPVMEQDSEFLVGVRHFCHQQMAGLPAVVRDKYRAKYDADARRLYDQAVAEQSEEQMREVYSQYRFSSYGDRALLWIANRALDGGRPELARVAYTRLARSPATPVPTLLRYALSAHLAGKPAEARQVLDRIRKEHGAAPVTVAGAKQTGAAAADALSKTLQAAPPPGEGPRWTDFAGDDGSRVMSGSVAGALQRQWGFIFPDDTDVNYTGTRSVVVGGGSSFGGMVWPAVAGDRVWVQGPAGVTALSLADGKPAWSREGDSLRADEIINFATDARGVSTRGTRRSLQTAPSIIADRLVTLSSLSVGGSSRGRTPIDYAVTMLDARDGTPLWQRVAGGDPRGYFFNLPSLTADAVLTGYTAYKGGITEYSAVALDPGTGEPLWSTYLGAGSDLLTTADGSPAAVRDGIVWIESSLYTLNALDLITGDIRLIYRYTPTRRGAASYRGGGLGGAPQVPNEPISLLASGPGPIVFSPRWGQDAVGIDPATLKLLWVSPKGPLPDAPGSLFAVDKKHAYIGGDHVQAINVSDGAREWVWEPDTTRSRLGYPALAGDRIYVPTGEKLIVLSAADGRVLEEIDIEEATKGASGTPTVTLVGRTALLAFTDRLVALQAR
ncbi:MAG: PQQ-binding-like beta-propeller repeat protein [Armatimonadota bacterium]